MERMQEERLVSLPVLRMPFDDHVACKLTAISCMFGVMLAVLPKSPSVLALVLRVIAEP